MAVSSTSVRAVFAGDGVTTAFPFVFRCLDPLTLSVFVTDASGVANHLPRAAYSVALAADKNGGTVTYPLGGAPIPAGTTLAVVRTLPLTQDTSFGNQSGWYPAAMNDALDAAAMRDQQIVDSLTRSLRTPSSEDGVAELPSKAQRAGRFLGFDANGNPSLTVSLVEISDVSQQIDAAIATATALVATATTASSAATSASVGAQQSAATAETFAGQSAAFAGQAAAVGAVAAVSAGQANAAAVGAQALLSAYSELLTQTTTTTPEALLAGAGPFNLGDLSLSAPFANERLAPVRADLARGGGTTIDLGAVT